MTSSLDNEVFNIKHIKYLNLCIFFPKEKSLMNLHICFNLFILLSPVFSKFKVYEGYVAMQFLIHCKRLAANKRKIAAACQLIYIIF